MLQLNGCIAGVINEVINDTAIFYQMEAGAQFILAEQLRSNFGYLNMKLFLEPVFSYTSDDGQRKKLLPDIYGSYLENDIEKKFVIELKFYRIRSFGNADVEATQNDLDKLNVYTQNDFKYHDQMIRPDEAYSILIIKDEKLQNSIERRIAFTQMNHQYLFNNNPLIPVGVAPNIYWYYCVALT